MSRGPWPAALAWRPRLPAATSPEPGDRRSPRWPLASGALDTADRRRPGMLSARTIYREIFDNEAFRLFCSIAASGEAQGGWENGKSAALVPGSQAGLAAKIARHGADEDKYGRIFTALLRKRGLEPAAVPP